MQARFQGTNDGLVRGPLAQRRESDICKHAVVSSYSCLTLFRPQLRSQRKLDPFTILVAVCPAEFSIPCPAE